MVLHNHDSYSVGRLASPRFQQRQAAPAQAGHALGCQRGGFAGTSPLCSPACLCDQATHTQTAVCGQSEDRSLPGRPEARPWCLRATPTRNSRQPGPGLTQRLLPQGTPRTPLTEPAGPGAAAARSGCPRAAGAPPWTAWCATRASAEGGWCSLSGSKIWVRTDDVCHHFRFSSVFTIAHNETKGESLPEEGACQQSPP